MIEKVRGEREGPAGCTGCKAQPSVGTARFQPALSASLREGRKPPTWLRSGAGIESARKKFTGSVPPAVGGSGPGGEVARGGGVCDSTLRLPARILCAVLRFVKSLPLAFTVSDNRQKVKRGGR